MLTRRLQQLVPDHTNVNPGGVRFEAVREGFELRAREQHLSPTFKRRPSE